MSLGYKIVNLDYMLQELTEEKTINILKEFSCVQNKDVENFLHDKSIEFSKMGIAKTHLVFASYKNKDVIAGYFALAGSKNFVISLKRKALSNTLKRKLKKFGVFYPEINQYVISAPLIGQLGKNSNLPQLITGSELLEMACEKVKNVQLDIGGKFVYLECENIPRLKEFYENNGFQCFGKRKLDADERDLKTKTLLQLLKYL